MSVSVKVLRGFLWVVWTASFLALAYCWMFKPQAVVSILAWQFAAGMGHATIVLINEEGLLHRLPWPVRIGVGVAWMFTAWTLGSVGAIKTLPAIPMVVIVSAVTTATASAFRIVVQILAQIFTTPQDY